MIKLKKIFIIFLVLFFVFSFSITVLGAEATAMDPNYDYLYTYTVVQDEQIKTLIETAEKDDRVISGNYSYMIYYNGGDKTYCIDLISNSYLESTLNNNIQGEYSNFSINGGWHNFNFIIYVWMS